MVSEGEGNKIQSRSWRAKGQLGRGSGFVDFFSSYRPHDATMGLLPVPTGRSKARERAQDLRTSNMHVGNPSVRQGLTTEDEQEGVGRGPRASNRKRRGSRLAAVLAGERLSVQSEVRSTASRTCLLAAKACTSIQPQVDLGRRYCSTDANWAGK